MDALINFIYCEICIVYNGRAIHYEKQQQMLLIKLMSPQIHQTKVHECKHLPQKDSPRSLLFIVRLQQTNELINFIYCGIFIILQQNGDTSRATTPKVTNKAEFTSDLSQDDFQMGIPPKKKKMKVTDSLQNFL